MQDTQRAQTQLISKVTRCRRAHARNSGRVLEHGGIWECPHTYHTQHQAIWSPRTSPKCIKNAKYAASTNTAYLQGDALQEEGACEQQWKSIGTKADILEYFQHSSRRAIQIFCVRDRKLILCNVFKKKTFKDDVKNVDSAHERHFWTTLKTSIRRMMVKFHQN